MRRSATGPVGSDGALRLSPRPPRRAVAGRVAHRDFRRGSPGERHLEVDAGLIVLPCADVRHRERDHSKMMRLTSLHPHFALESTLRFTLILRWTVRSLHRHHAICYCLVGSLWARRPWPATVTLFEPIHPLLTGRHRLCDEHRSCLSSMLPRLFQPYRPSSYACVVHRGHPTTRTPGAGARIAISRRSRVRAPERMLRA